MQLAVADLWLPILLSGGATHIASTIAWTVLPHHTPEFKGLGEHEDEVLSTLEKNQIGPGQYMLPFCEDMKAAKDPAFIEKQKRCTGLLAIYDKPVNMGAAIGLTLAFFLLAAFMMAAVLATAFEPGEDKGEVFRLAFAVGVLTHCFGKFPAVFWFPQKWVTSVLDGLVFALITAAIFAYLWPDVAPPAALPTIKYFE